MITCEGLAFSWSGRRVVDELSFTVPDGRVLGIVGPNGSGKTTALRLISGALRPEAGRVLLDGQPLDHLSQRMLARRVAVVAQHEMSDAALTVTDTVMLGRIPHRAMLASPTSRDYEVCAHALQQVGIAALAQRSAARISGGEAQRAVIARALAQQADHILLDEPTNHLDLHHQHEVLHLIRDTGATCVVVLHDLNLAARYCDEVLLLDQGRLVASGPPSEVLSTANIEQIYRIPAEVITLASGTIHLILGEDTAAEPATTTARTR
ncbi:MAG: ABC transporter ATP-binding protein [Propioniciclava sp.]